MCKQILTLENHGTVGRVGIIRIKHLADLYTKTDKIIAEKRNKIALTFFDQLRKELNLEDF